jgi:hypothetical protein
VTDEPTRTERRRGKQFLLASFLLPVTAAVLFLIECDIFHFPISTGIDVLWLAGLTILPGTLIVLIIAQYFRLSVTADEILMLGSVVGFGIPSFVLMLIHAIGLPHGTTVFYVIRFSFTAAGLGLILTRKITLGIADQIRALNRLWITLICVLLWFACYNLPNFHFTPNGNIVTHGLFGVDIPFLAGEVHGIQDYGTLRDLHQMAQPWHYHDATYQLLALLSKDHTIADLSFAAPLVGYTLLAYAIFVLLFHFTARKALAIAGASAWFLIGSFTGTEQGSYALSPSFVFGSLIFVTLFLVLDKWSKEISSTQKITWSLLLFYFFIELSQTKLSTFLVLIAAMSLLGLMLVRARKIAAFTLFGIALVSFVIVVIQMSGKNPLMPGDDFLIGAPLLGYANHIAAALHIPVSAVNPVSHGLHLHLQSLFIVPYFIFHFARFAAFDPRILSCILLLLFFRKELFGQQLVSREVLYILLLLIPLGYFLPVLYSPAWYPLALSFYAPLVSNQSAMLLTIIGTGAIISNPITRTSRIILGLASILFLFGFFQNIHSILDEDFSHSDTVDASLVSAMNVLAQQDDTALVASHRFDFDRSRDESFYWYSALSGHPVISEGAKYGSLLAAVADTDREKGLHPVAEAERTLAGRRALLDTIYLSHDSASVLRAIQSSGVAFAIEDRSSTFQVDPHSFGNSIFSNGEYTIWKVRK